MCIEFINICAKMPNRASVLAQNLINAVQFYGLVVSELLRYLPQTRLNLQIGYVHASNVHASTSTNYGIDGLFGFSNAHKACFKQAPDPELLQLQELVKGQEHCNWITKRR